MSRCKWDQTHPGIGRLETAVGQVRSRGVNHPLYASLKVKEVVEVKEQGYKLDTFVDYLKRHIEVDGEEHTPLATQMLADLCSDYQARWQECAHAVNLAPAVRCQSWHGILEAINSRRAEASPVPCGTRLEYADQR